LHMQVAGVTTSSRTYSRCGIGTSYRESRTRWICPCSTATR
jgi:hypothetical protein